MFPPLEESVYSAMRRTTTRRRHASVAYGSVPGEIPARRAILNCPRWDDDSEHQRGAISVICYCSDIGFVSFLPQVSTRVSSQIFTARPVRIDS
jgi:hypothetical protein